jgi:poly-beta-1,6-N-acetyl-D-glucosamine synthase
MRTFLIVLTWFCIVGQGYHYLGYPALLFLLSRLSPRPPRRGSDHPPVSLVIAAYDEASVIREKLENSLWLDYPRLQIVVVSDGSKDSTPSIVRSYRARGVVGLHQPERRGKAEAINRAGPYLTGEIIVFSDANALYRADAIQNLVRNFADPAVGCVTGRRTVECSRHERHPATASGESFYWRYESAVKELETLIASTMGVCGEMLAIRRPLVVPLPAGLINDDAYFALSILRKGYRVIYEPEAVCWEAPTRSMQDEIVRRQRITAGRYQLLFGLNWWPWNRPAAVLMLISHKVLRLLLPFLMIGALLANAVLEAFFTVPAALHATLAAQLVFYGLAVLGLLTQRIGRHWKIPAAAYYVLAGNLGSLRGFYRFLMGQQTALWQKATR